MSEPVRLLDSQRAGIEALRRKAHQIADEIDSGYDEGGNGLPSERTELVRLGVPRTGPAEVSDLEGIERAGERWHKITGDTWAWRLADDARALRRWIEETNACPASPINDRIAAPDKEAK